MEPLQVRYNNCICLRACILGYIQAVNFSLNLSQYFVHRAGDTCIYVEDYKNKSMHV